MTVSWYDVGATWLPLSVHHPREKTKENRCPSATNQIVQYLHWKLTADHVTLQIQGSFRAVLGQF